MASCASALRVSFFFGVLHLLKEAGSSAASKGVMDLQRKAARPQGRRHRRHSRRARHENEKTRNTLKYVEECELNLLEPQIPPHTNSK